MKIMTRQIARKTPTRTKMRMKNKNQRRKRRKKKTMSNNSGVMDSKE